MDPDCSSIDDNLLESAARCLDPDSVRALGQLQLGVAARSRLQLLAHKANKGELSADEAREYARFLELGDVIETLWLKAGRQVLFALNELSPVNRGG